MLVAYKSYRPTLEQKYQDCHRGYVQSKHFWFDDAMAG